MGLSNTTADGSHGVAWAKLRIFGRLPPLMGRKKRDGSLFEGQLPPKRRRDPKGRRRRSQAPTRRQKPFIRLIFKQMDFSAPTAPDFAALHCFSKSKSICVDASAKAGRFTLYGHRRTAEKEEVVFYRGQNYCFYFEQTQFFRRNFSTLSKNREHRPKTSGLSLELSLFFAPTTLLFGNIRHSAASPSRPLAFPRAQTRPNGHAPTHIAHSASFHFLPSPFTFTHNTLIIKRNKGEGKHRFNTSPVKATQALPSHLTLSAPKFYAHEVKR